MGARDFTYEEDKLLLGSDMSLDEIAKKINREKYSVSRRLRNLRKQRYTVERLEDEERFIVEVYHYLSIRDIERHLDIPYQLIRSRIRALKSQNKLKKIEFEYKNNDDKYLLKNRQNLSLKQMAEHLGYSKGKIAVRLNHLNKTNPPKKKEVNLDSMKLKQIGEIPLDALTLEEIKSKLKLTKGKIYEIYTPKTAREKSSSYFAGKFIGETDNFIILRNNNGYNETFLKVDFLTNERRIKEVK